jgi:hypothetical protein
MYFLWNRGVSGERGIFFSKGLTLRPSETTIVEAILLPGLNVYYHTYAWVIGIGY